MRLLGAVAVALLLCGCTGTNYGNASSAGDSAARAVHASDRVAQAGSFAEKAAAANAVCSEQGRKPGTAQHADCVKRLLRAEGERARDLAATLAKRAAQNHYTCIDQAKLRLVRCYDI